jgi:hypothetical protein
MLSMKFAWVLSALGATACAQPPTDAECLDLVERYAGKLLRTNNPDLSEAEVMRLQHEARARAEDDPMLGRCRHRVSRRDYQCAMQAPNPDEMEKCLLP